MVHFAHFVYQDLGGNDGPFNATPQIGDFNGDGRQDILFVGGTRYSYVLLGRGDGTFAPFVFQDLGGNDGPFNAAPQIADFNGDHRQDLIFLIDPYSYTLLGLGNGAFKKFVYQQNSPLRKAL